MAFNESEEFELNIFVAQCLQLVNPSALRWPSLETLRKVDAQQRLYISLFDRDNVRYQLPARYQARILKYLLGLIESAQQSPDDDEISDDLMSSLSSLLAAPLPAEAVAVQQRSYVTYSFPPYQSHRPVRAVTTLETPGLLSSDGTTGLRTWEAALHLGSYLAREGTELIRGKRVLELGAGTGVLSILCAKHLGAMHTTATDGNEMVVSALRENVFVNGLEGDPRISSVVLRWGSPFIETQFDDDSGFDVVLGSDITFDTSAVWPLVNTLRQLLDATSNATVLISATIRSERTFARFSAACAQNRLAITNVEFPLSSVHDQTGPFYSTEIPIRILRIGYMGETVDLFTPEKS